MICGDRKNRQLKKLVEFDVLIKKGKEKENR